MEIQVLTPENALQAVDSKLKILSLIERDSGLGHEKFERFMAPVILGLSKSVLSAPLSRDLYAYKNGALEYGLISAMMALRIAEGSIFTQGTVEDRSLYEPQYKFACFCAAIVSVPAILFSSVSISNADGEIWSPLSSEDSLSDWLGGCESFQANWFNKNIPISRMLGAAMSWKIFPSGIWNKFDSRIIAQMFESVNPPESPTQGESKVTSIVRKAHEKAVELYHQSNEHQFLENAQSPNNPGILNIRSEIRADELLIKTNAIKNHTQPSQPDKVEQQKPVVDFKKMDRAVLELFDAITSDPKYSVMRPELRVSSKGVELPLKFIGYGLEVRGTIRLLEGEKLVIEKLDASVILHPDCTPYLVK